MTVHLVTGATGFLGAVLVDRLAALGTGEVRCLVREGRDRSRLDAVASRHPQARVQIVQGGLQTAEDAGALLPGVDIVYHLAARLSGPPDEVFAATVVASENLLEALVRARPRPRTVLCSSIAVYGTADLPDDRIIDETAALEEHPDWRDAYAQAKLRQERLFHEYASRFGLEVAIARPGPIYGPSGPRMPTRVGVFTRGVFAHLGGPNLLPLTYVDNCADAIAIIGERAQFGCDAYNVCDDELVTCAEYLARYRSKVEPVRSVRLPYSLMMPLMETTALLRRWSGGRLPAGISPYTLRTMWRPHRFSNARIQALGWRPLVATEEGLRRTFEWLQNRSGRAAGRSRG